MKDLISRNTNSDVLFEHATEGILVVDQKGVIVKANPSALKLFGYSKDELVGELVETLVPISARHNHVANRESFTQGPHSRSMGSGMSLSGRRKDGTELPVEISLSHYKTDSGTYVIAFIIDITTRKQAEQKLKNYSLDLERQVEKRTLVLREAIIELEKTREELRTTLRKEKDLNDLKSRFVSMASHEFRTPLSTILSSVALIGKYNQQGQEEKRSRHIDRIKSMVNNLTEILNDFLSLSRLEEGKIDSVSAEFDLRVLCEEVKQEMQVIAKPGQIIEFVDNIQNVHAFLDRKLVKNICINLLSNALKFSPENSEVLMKATTIGHEILLEFIDKGIGIPEEEHHHLFERFFRGHNVTNIQGTGLGLNIVAKYLELLGGTIDFRSKLNHGTTFIIQLPLRGNDHEPHHH